MQKRAGVVIAILALTTLLAISFFAVRSQNTTLNTEKNDLLVKVSSLTYEPEKLQFGFRAKFETSLDMASSRAYLRLKDGQNILINISNTNESTALYSGTIVPGLKYDPALIIRSGKRESIFLIKDFAKNSPELPLIKQFIKVKGIDETQIIATSQIFRTREYGESPIAKVEVFVKPKNLTQYIEATAVTFNTFNYQSGILELTRDNLGDSMAPKGKNLLSSPLWATLDLVPVSAKGFQGTLNHRALSNFSIKKGPSETIISATSGQDLIRLKIHRDPSLLFIEQPQRKTMVFGLAKPSSQRPLLLSSERITLHYNNETQLLNLLKTSLRVYEITEIRQFESEMILKADVHFESSPDYK